MSRKPRLGLQARGLAITALELDMFKPLLRAYALGLLSTTSPRVVSSLLGAVTGRMPLGTAASRIYKTARSQIGLTTLPTTCAILLGGATLLPVPIKALLDYVLSTASPQKGLLTSARRDAAAKFVAALSSALVAFRLLNGRPADEEHFNRQTLSVPSLTDVNLARPPADIPALSTQRRRSSLAFSTAEAAGGRGPPLKTLLGGRTLDLSFFVLVRALDIGISSTWRWYKARSSSPRAHMNELIERLTSPAIFATSSCAIMWAWFYMPHRLPASYNTWIASAAQLDSRLLLALRDCRYGNFIYGQDTGANYLESMCEELGLPRSWGNPAKTIPVPCKLYHEGITSCEVHALSRFARAWRFAMGMYLPLNLLVRLRKGSAERLVIRAVQDAAKSSSFLGAFVALFYYGVCLARTRVLPKLFSRTTYSPMLQDGGACVATGCALCGLSIFAEQAGRRQEMAFFVAPRALATILPRRYDRKHLWREEIVFALSSAVVLTTSQVRPEHVSGVFGKLLSQILA